MHTEKAVEQEKALLAGARAFLAEEVGVIETARILSRFDFNKVRLELRDSVIVFVGVDSETDAFPLGKVRELWNPNSLAKLDIEIAKAAELYNSRVRKACETIVRVLG